MEYVILWLLCGVIAAAIGARKGEGCGAFLVGCLLGPFGILFAIMSSGNRIACPFCKEMMNKRALVCPHCQRDIPEKGR